MMTAISKRKTSLNLDASALDEARTLGINVSAVADGAIRRAVEEARRERWLSENAEAFRAQAAWHEANPHPLSDIMAGPGAETWRS
jgi:antitoxin CcdA